MADQIFILDGDENVVSEFKEGLLKLGMIPIEVDAIAASKEKLRDASDLDKKNNPTISFEDMEFFGKKDNSQYAVEPITMLTLAVTLLGSAGFASIVTTILKAHKGEGSIDIDEKGNITKVIFKDMNPKNVPKMIEEISQAAREAGKLNKKVLLSSTSEGNSSTDEIEN